MIDFVDKVNQWNDEFTVFNQARKKLKNKNPSTSRKKKMYMVLRSEKAGSNQL